MVHVWQVRVKFMVGRNFYYFLDSLDLIYQIYIENL